jgi:2-amino-4-hydroxy-6-hydroxymethyldihydropteridine diphosphokinase
MNITNTQTILSFGANIGNAEKNFSTAIKGLVKAGLADIKISPLYKTAPEECTPNAPDFTNAAIFGLWPLSLKELFNKCKKLEKEAGRPEKYPKYSPRSLDIDIIFFGSTVFSDNELTVPHNKVLSRLFVLIPVADIAPDFVIPKTTITIEKYIKSFCEKDKEKIRQTAKKLDLFVP